MPYRDINQRGFNWHIWGLMALGFFANSYSLCSMKTALPSIAFSIWKRDDIGPNGLKINTAILAGSIIGQPLFGYLADRYSRLEFYGGHFFSLAFLTLFFAQSSSGYDSMPMMGLLMSWGFFAGVCNGAGRLLAAIITAEYVGYFFNILKAVHSLFLRSIIK
jgi:MFS transporter, PHS family, inorganic phosphate transporter